MWQERVRPAAYTSPSGVRMVFGFEDLKKAVDKLITVFEFPNVGASLVEDLGITSPLYPLKCVFAGPDHDLEAQSFERGLSEQGIGLLEHPLEGRIDVVPISFSRLDALKTANNQTVITVEFQHSLRDAYPSASRDPASDVEEAALGATAALQAEADGLIDIDAPGVLEQLSAAVESMLSEVRSRVAVAAELVGGVQATYDALENQINDAITVIVRDPLTLAFQISQLIRAPARAASALERRLDGYRDLIRLVVARDSGGEFENVAVNASVQNSQAQASRNEFALDDIAVGASVQSFSDAILSSTFSTRAETVRIAIELEQLLTRVITWREERMVRLGINDSGATVQALQSLVSGTIEYLASLSITLAVERSVVLGRNRTPLDLCAELYGDVERLDFLIDTNRIRGREILELRKGRGVVFYV